MKAIIRFIGENIFFIDKRNPKLRVLKALCSLLIIAVIVFGCVYSIGYIKENHRKIVAAAAEMASDVGQGEQTEEQTYGNLTAVRFTGEEGDPYKLTGIQAYLDSAEDGVLSMEIGTITGLDVRLISVQDADRQYTYDFTEKTTLEATKGPIIFYTYTFEKVAAKLTDDPAGVLINYMYDDNVLRSAWLIPYKKLNNVVHYGTDIRTQDNTGEFDFISVQDDDVFFEGPSVTIDQPLFIPAGKRLVLTAGQSIDLTNSAYIVVRGPIEAVGTNDNGIRVYTSDETGRGLFVCQADESSRLSFVTFEGLDTPDSGIWHLSGAVTFYESDVDIDHCLFTDNVCEDLLNIVRSHFYITESEFANTFADAFDSDFSTGEITGCVYHHTGNDAVDVSTTTLTLSDTNFYDIGDKGISGGEKSTIQFSNVTIETANIGLASKDLTQMTGSGVVINNAAIGLALYRKKPEYGPATMILSDVKMTVQVDMPYLIQEGSALQIDGRAIQPKSLAKESLIIEKIINGEPLV